MHQTKTNFDFSGDEVNLAILKQRAYNLRWAMVPEGVIPLTAADPDFPCAPPIREAIRRFTDSGYFCYAPPEGYAFFRESAARFFLEKRNVNYNPAHIQAVDSAAAGIFMTCEAFLNAGDEAIVFDPIDFLFRHSVEAVGGKAIPFPVPMDPRGDLDFDLLEKLAGPKTRIICVCNPLNPTGKVLTKIELSKLVEFAVRHNLVILSDEIWSDIVFEPAVFTSIASLSQEAFNRTITITGFSKSYGLAGLRAGAVLAPDESSFSKILAASGHQSTVHGCNSLGQVAATAALDECQDWLSDFLSHLRLMRNKTVSELNEMPGISCPVPDGCYLAFPDIRATGMSPAQLQENLLNNARVAVVPGLPRWFGEKADGHIRICFATSDEILSEALFRIKNYLNTIL
jgi:aspartate/methionine/tyrosine aminotransferase